METTEATIEHRHHWVIEPANGPRSPGVCKHCHAQRDFANWLIETDFMGREEVASVGASSSYGAGARTRNTW